MSDLDKIKSLRDETGLSMGEIKKALDEAGGDETKARDILSKLGLAAASKRASRAVKEGVVDSYIHGTRKVGSMIELLCETDFVAKNEAFKSLAHDIAMQAVAMKTESTDDLLAQPFVKNPEITIKELINQAIAKLGENIQLGKVQVFEI